MNKAIVPGAGVGGRGFVTRCVWGGAALAVGAGASTLLPGCSSDPGPASGYKHLRDKDVTLLRPLMAPLLGGGLEAVDGAGPDQALQALDRLLQGGTGGPRGQLFHLLDVLPPGAARPGSA